MRRIPLTLSLLALMVTLLAAVAAPPARAAAPTVTLTDPASGGLITGGQPTFSGRATDAPTATGRVTVSIYAGTAAGGLPVQVDGATVAHGSYSVSSTLLADGTYTAVASESDTGGHTGSSQPVTFQLFTGTPGLTLSAPATPITTPAPTLSGTAETGNGAAASVSVTIYPGTSTDTTPLSVVTASVGASGAFSAQITPGLANGTYTAVASQDLALSTTYSRAVTFTVAATAPTLSITSPTAAGSEPQTGISFAGAAGSAYGDAGTVALDLYSGPTASGTPLGTLNARVSAGRWRVSWPTTLALGTYTLLASQSDFSGQTTQVSARFTVLAPGTVSPRVTISDRGRLQTRLSCLTGAGICRGDVLILTTERLRTVRGGPRGRLALMFDHYVVRAGESRALTAQLSRAQLSALARNHGARLAITVAYDVNGQLTETSQRTGRVTVQRSPARGRRGRR